MKRPFALALVAPVLLLSACSPAQVAQTAADAAACSAAQASLSTLADLYRQGLVDSGVKDTVQALVGEPVQQLLSSPLAADFKAISEVLASSATATEAADRIDQLVSDITMRCGEVGVNF
jgi:hypothetical protein